MAEILGRVLEGGVAGTKWEPVCACIYACGVESRAEEWREMKWRIQNESTRWGFVSRK
jgi:hypothetical protein